jgi:hypothetical protein
LGSLRPLMAEESMSDAHVNMNERDRLLEDWKPSPKWLTEELFGGGDRFGAASPQTEHPKHRRLNLTKKTRHDNQVTMHDWLVGAEGKCD